MLFDTVTWLASVTKMPWLAVALIDVVRDDHVRIQTGHVNTGLGCGADMEAVDGDIAESR